MKSVRELTEERNRLVAENRTLLDGAEGGTLTAEQEQEWQRRDAEIDRLNGEIEARNSKAAKDERRKQYDAMLADDGPRQVPPARGGDGAELSVPYGRGSLVLLAGTPEHARAQAAYRKKFLSYTLAGRDGEQLGLQVSKDPKGGYLAPVTVVARLIKFVDDNLFFRQLATVLPPLGAAVSLGVPSLDTDPGDGDWTPEVPASDISEDDGITFGKRELMPHLLTKLVKLSRKLLRSSVLDAEELVTLRIGYKMRVALEKAYLVGTGSQQPLGVFVASANGISTGRDVTASAATNFKADDLIDLKFNCKSQYQMTGVWVAHRDFYKMCRKLKDGDGQYLWQPGLQGQPNTLLDRPTYMSEFAPSTFTASQYVAVFGDFKAGYWIADSLEMEVQSLMELFARTNQIGLLARLESDGMPVLEEAFSRLKLSA